MLPTVENQLIVNEGEPDAMLRKASDLTQAECGRYCFQLGKALLATRRTSGELDGAIVGANRLCMILLALQTERRINGD